VEPIVYVTAGEEFEWISTKADSCDIHIIDDHPLDQDDYHVVRGTPTPATVIGSSGTYAFECKCKGKGKTNPKIIIN
jgi:hypothetical protein